MSQDENDPMPPRPTEVELFAPVAMTAAQKSALWSRVKVSAALVPPGPATPAPATPAGPVATAAGASVVRWGVAALAAGIAVGAGVDRFGFPPEPKVIERVVVRTEQVRVEVPVPAPAAAPPAPAPPIAPPRPPRTAAGHLAEPTPARPEPLAPPPADEGPNVERQLLEGARTALMRRDPNSALQTLENARRDFPRGLLVEERDSLQVQALQQARRDAEAKAAAKAFLERYPHSVFGPAVEGILHDEN